MSFATVEEALELLDDWAAEDPLDALREGIAEYVIPHRLDAMALAEPEAALVYAYDLLTPERQAWCLAEAAAHNFNRFVPDRLRPERQRALAMAREWVQPAWTPPTFEAVAPARQRPAPRTQPGYVIACDVCGVEFRARRADARCCSARCRQKAARAARRAPPGGDQPEAGAPRSSLRRRRPPGRNRNPRGPAARRRRQPQSLRQGEVGRGRDPRLPHHSAAFATGLGRAAAGALAPQGGRLRQRLVSGDRDRQSRAAGQGAHGRPRRLGARAVSAPRALAAALRYAGLGWRIHPFEPGGKRPLLADWPRRATTNAGLIERWFTRTPDANVAVATGPGSGVFVLDVDGPEGERALAALERQHGALPELFPMQWTGGGRGGWQAFFAWPVGRCIRNNVGRLGAKLDTRGEAAPAWCRPAGPPSPTAGPSTAVPGSSCRPRPRPPGWSTCSTRRQRQSRHRGPRSRPRPVEPAARTATRSRPSRPN